MRIIKTAIDPKKKDGYVVVVPIDEEDIWYIYNIVMVGDILRLKTMRKILHQKGGEFSVKTTLRKLITLTVKVLEVKFQADETGTSLMLKTRNLSENEFVMKGQVQTIEVQLLQKIQIIKEHWDPQTRNFLEESANASVNVDSIVVLLDEGYGAFYTIKRNYIKLHGKVTKSMPKKKTAIMDIYNKKVEEFDASIWKYLFESFSGWESVKAVILAGPGNTRVRIFDKLKKIDQSEKSEILRKMVRANLHKFASIQTSSTFKSAIGEIMKDKTGAKLLEDTKAVKEVKKLEEFYATFMKNSNLAVFGEKEVRFSHENSAIKSLLITDGLLRSRNYVIRRKMVAFVNSIQNSGAEIFVFNENHESGARLKDITGIAAILRFPVDVENIREEETAKDEHETDHLNHDESEEQNDLNDSFIANGDLFLNDD